MLLHIYCGNILYFDIFESNKEFLPFQDRNSLVDLRDGFCGAYIDLKQH